MIGARTRCPWGENLCATSSTFAGRRHMIGKVVTGCVAILPYHTATQDRGSECRDFGFISRIVTALLDMLFECKNVISLIKLSTNEILGWTLTLVVRETWCESLICNNNKCLNGEMLHISNLMPATGLKIVGTGATKALKRKTFWKNSAERTSSN